MPALTDIIPILRTLKTYSRETLSGDLSAGLTVAIMLIPQGMAYAMLAGLPPIVGLYASTLPIAAYAIFGTSRQLAVGPVAMVSLMVASAISAVGASATDALSVALLLSLMVGLFQLLMGVMRIGFLVNLLAHPVVSGFTSAAALIIAASQLNHLLGLNLPKSASLRSFLAAPQSLLSNVNFTTFAIGIGSVALLFALRRISKKIPAALIAVVLGTLAVYFGGLSERGVSIVGKVPAGLPALSLPNVEWSVIKTLVPTALALSLVGFMESISVAKKFARENRYEVNANQELIGLGLANLLAGLFQGYPVTGGLSRTAVNAQAGARTTIASLITAVVIALTLVFFTPLFYYLPKAVLAAIIVVAVASLVDIHEVKHLWKVKRSDLTLLAITFVSTLALGIEEGIVVGVVSSLLAVILRTTRPHTAVLGRVPGTQVFRNVKRHAGLELFPGVLVLRIDAQFFFGNVAFLRETLSRLVSEAEHPIRSIVLNAATINHLDSTADAALHDLARDFSDQGIGLYFANVRGPVEDVMRASGFVDRLGDEHFAASVHEAVEKAQTTVLSNPLNGHSAMTQSVETMKTASPSWALAPVKS